MTFAIPRRAFLRCLTGIIAAPAIIKADRLMRVVAPRQAILSDLYTAEFSLSLENLLRAKEMLKRNWPPDIANLQRDLVAYGSAAWRVSYADGEIKYENVLLHQ